MALSAAPGSAAGAPQPAADRQAFDRTLRADAPSLHLPGLRGADVSPDPVNTDLAPLPGRRLWARPLAIDADLPGDRATLSIRVRCAVGQLLAWPADDPWLRLHRTPTGGVRLAAGPDRLDGAPINSGDPPCRAGRWQTLTVVVDGPAGRIGLFINGRAAATRARAPLVIPPGAALGIGPAAGDVADLALWPDAIGPDRLLDHHLASEGLRPAPEPRRVELTVRRTSGSPHFGCPRFSPDGGWLAGCHSNGLVFVDGPTGEPTGIHLEHLEPLTAVDIDPTGRFIATADGSSAVLIWRVATQHPEIRLNPGHAIAGVSFAPDGRTLALWSPRDRPGRLTRVPFHSPGAPPETQRLPGSIHHAVWRPDGAQLAIALADAAPHRTGRSGSVAALPLPRATALAWHPTDDRLFVGTLDGAVWRHDARGSHAIRPAPRSVGAPPAGRLPTLFDPDGGPTSSTWVIGRRWADFGRPPWRPTTDRRAIVALAADARRVATADDDGARLMDHDGGRVRRLAHPTPATAVVLTRGLLLTGAADGTLRRFAATDGRPLGETPDTRRDASGHPFPVRSIGVSPDGARIVVDHLGPWKARPMPLEAGPTPAPAAPSPPPWSRLSVSPSGLQILVAHYTGHLVGWDLDRLRRIRGFAAESPATSLVWTDDGPISGHMDGRLWHWSVDGRPLGADAVHAGTVHPTDRQYMPTGGVDGLFALGDGTWVSSGRLAVSHGRGQTRLSTHALPTPSLQITRPVMDGAERLIISTIAGLIRVDPRSGRSEAFAPPPGGIAGAPYVQLAAGGRSVAAVRYGSAGATLNIWPPDAAEPLDVPLPFSAQTLAFSADGRRLAVAGAVRSPGGEWRFPILLVDPATGGTTARIEGHRVAISAARFEVTRTGELRLHTGSWDGHERVYRIDDRGGARQVSHRVGCPAMALEMGPSRVALCTDRIQVDRGAGRLTLADDPDGRWLVATDDGLFAASREGDRLASAIAGPRIVGLDRLALARNRPDLIADRFGLGDRALRADLARRVRLRGQRQGLRVDPPPLDALPRVDLAPVHVVGPDAVIRAGARAASDLARWRIRADGSPIAEGRLRGRTDRFEARIPLIDGLNVIEVDAADSAGRWSPRARARVTHADPRPPRLFVVAFGVSRYADPAIRDLRFAHQDALDLVGAFETGGGPWADVITRAFTDEAVVPGAFAEAEALLARAEPRDTVIIFVSGHGLYDRRGVYRYLTHDARLAAVEESVPFDRVEGLLDATRARHRLMLLDTCQSGELFDDANLERPAPVAPGAMQARVMPLASGRARLIRPIAASPAPAEDRRDRFVDRDLRRGRGAVVFSSSRGAEASWELESLANGAFTEALLSGLSGAADPDGDGWIALGDLRDYVAREVARLTGDRQHPTIDRENRAARITLPMLNDRNR